MASAMEMEPMYARLGAQTELNTRIKQMLRETMPYVDLPEVKPIHQLATKAKRDLQKIYKNEGKLVQMRRENKLTDGEKKRLMDWNLQLHLDAEAGTDAAWMVYTAWKAKFTP